MNDLEPWKIWAVTGALVCLILGRAETCVRPLPANNGVAQAATISTNQHSGNTANMPAQWPDEYESYSPGFSPRTFSRFSNAVTWPYGASSLRPTVYNSAIVLTSITDDLSEPEIDVTRELAYSDSALPEGGDLLAMDNSGRNVVGWFAEDNESQDLTNWVNSDNNGWVLPVTGEDTVSLAWQSAALTGEARETRLTAGWTPGSMPIDTPTSLALDYPQETNEATALYIVDRTSVSNMLGDANDSDIGISQLVQLADSGESQDASEVVNTLRTQAVEQLLEQAAEEQEAFSEYVESAPGPAQGAGWPNYEVRAINYW